MESQVLNYIEPFPEPLKQRMMEMRAVIFEEIPDVLEGFGYQMPAYVFQKKRFYFACFTNHIGFFPGPAVIDAFKDRLTSYKTSKGTIQFQHSQDFPMDLFRQIILYIKSK